MKQELIKRFEKEYPDVPVYTELESTELHRDFINWLISTVIADLNRQLEGFKSQYNTDAEKIADLQQEYEEEVIQAALLSGSLAQLQEKYDKKNKTVQNQAAKIAELVKHIESNDECHKGKTARKCHCEDLQKENERLK